MDFRGKSYEVVYVRTRRSPPGWSTALPGRRHGHVAFKIVTHRRAHAACAASALMSLVIGHPQSEAAMALVLLGIFIGIVMELSGARAAVRGRRISTAVDHHAGVLRRCVKLWRHLEGEEDQGRRARG